MAKFVSHKKGAPKGAVTGRQNDAGELHAVITISDAGRVPGKAKGSQAWYSMGGKEHLTNDFEYIKCKNVQLVRSNGGAPPAGAIIEGQQKDGNHALAPCIAHSPHGDVPAKTLASGGKQAWYAWGGAEHCVESFSWLVSAGFKLKRKAKPPKSAIEARQKDGATIYLALANTPHGQLPAKAAGDTAWYAHGGKEHTTKDFEYVCAKKYHTKEANAPSKPARCIECGQQNDAAGALVPVLCFTEHGEIFGKALRKGGNTAWYPYGGAEHTTSKFSYFELK